MQGKKPKNNITAPSAENNNYFAPLQTINDDDIESEEMPSATKTHIPLITILKCKIEEVHELCKICKINDYSIRKMTIGLKFFCNHKKDFEEMCKILENKYEFFTYATKEEKPYKALLFGLETQDPMSVKTKLINMGLQCTDVKIVHQKSRYGSFIIYVVYFKRKTITMRELRHNYSKFDKIQISWDFQSVRKNRITQCHNCQMFGHGQSRCNVKTFCANCAGNHKTSECKENTVKCANCTGSHKSTDVNCPSKMQYLEIKERNRPKNIKQRKVDRNFTTHNNKNFPNSLNQGMAQQPSAWVQQRNYNNQLNYDNTNSPNFNNTATNAEELFSVQEIQQITLELINKRRNCKSKLDQFEVITSIASKFI
ncbi:uncharacterized protein [Musca autumnalis]|uniref:uncharacterized protein n=1 Tax=Musca autumnalis TaxID=221902 RepID=UPI003CE97261